MKKNTCGSFYRHNHVRIDKDKEGLMEVVQHSVRGGEREREQTQKTLLQNNTLKLCHRMCSEGTFIQVLYGLSEVLTGTSMLINESLH